MNALTDEQIARLIDLLDARRREVEAVIREHVGQLRDSSVPDLTAAAGDLADQAELALARDHENAAVVRDVRELRELEAARERLSGGSAGVCSECGNEIGFDRLQVQPAAVRCVDCQAWYEQTHLPASDVAP